MVKSPIMFVPKNLVTSHQSFKQPNFWRLSESGDFKNGLQLYDQYFTDLTDFYDFCAKTNSNPFGNTVHGMCPGSGVLASFSPDPSGSRVPREPRFSDSVCSLLCCQTTQEILEYQLAMRSVGMMKRNTSRKDQKTFRCHSAEYPALLHAYTGFPSGW